MKNHWLQQKKIDKVLQAQIDRIMKAFDFDRIRTAIPILGIPYTDVDKMEDHARHLLEKTAVKDDWGCLGVDCGSGFTAEKLPNGSLVLHFSLDLWSEQP